MWPVAKSKCLEHQSLINKINRAECVTYFGYGIIIYIAFYHSFEQPEFTPPYLQDTQSFHVHFLLIDASA